MRESTCCVLTMLAMATSGAFGQGQPLVSLPSEPDGVGVSDTGDQVVVWRKSDSATTFSVVNLNTKAVTTLQPVKELGSVRDAMLVSNRLVVAWDKATGQKRPSIRRSLHVHSMPDLKTVWLEKTVGYEVGQLDGHLFVDRGLEIGVIDVRTAKELLSLPYPGRSNERIFSGSRFGPVAGVFALDESLKPIVATVDNYRFDNFMPLPVKKIKRTPAGLVDVRSFNPPGFSYHDGRGDKLTAYTNQNGMWLNAQVRPNPTPAGRVIQLRAGKETRQITPVTLLGTKRERGSLLAMTPSTIVIVRGKELFTQPVPDFGWGKTIPKTRDNICVVPTHNRILIRSDERSVKLTHRVHHANGACKLTMLWSGGEFTGKGTEITWDAAVVKKRAIEALRKSFERKIAKGTLLRELLEALQNRKNASYLKLLNPRATDVLVDVPVIVTAESADGQLDTCKYLLVQCLTVEEAIEGISSLDDDSATGNEKSPR